METGCTGDNSYGIKQESQTEDISGVDTSKTTKDVKESGSSGFFSPSDSMLLQKDKDNMKCEMSKSIDPIVQQDFKSNMPALLHNKLHVNRKKQKEIEFQLNVLKGNLLEAKAIWAEICLNVNDMFALSSKDKNSSHIRRGTYSYFIDTCSTSHSSQTEVASSDFLGAGTNDRTESCPASSGFISFLDNFMARDIIPESAMNEQFTESVRSIVSNMHDDDDTGKQDEEHILLALTEDHYDIPQQRPDLTNHNVNVTADVIEHNVKVTVLKNNLMKIQTILHETLNICSSIINQFAVIPYHESTSQRSTNQGSFICSDLTDTCSIDQVPELLSDDPAETVVEDQKQDHVDVSDTLSQPVNCVKSQLNRMFDTEPKARGDRNYPSTVLLDQPSAHQNNGEVEQKHMALNQKSFHTDNTLDLCSSISGLNYETEALLICKSSVETISHDPKLSNVHLLNKQDAHVNQPNITQENFEVDVAHTAFNQETLFKETSIHCVSTNIPSGCSVPSGIPAKEKLTSDNCKIEENLTNKQDVQTDIVQSEQEHFEVGSTHMTFNQEICVKDTPLQFDSVSPPSGFRSVAETAVETATRNVETDSKKKENSDTELDIQPKVPLVGEYVEHTSHDDRQYDSSSYIRDPNILPLTDDQDNTTYEESLEFVRPHDTDHELQKTTESYQQRHINSQMYHMTLEQEFVRIESSLHPDLNNTLSESDIAAGAKLDLSSLDMGSAVDYCRADGSDESQSRESEVRGACASGHEVQHHRENSHAVPGSLQNIPVLIEEHREMEWGDIGTHRTNLPVIEMEDDDRIADVNLLQTINMRNPPFPLPADVTIHNGDGGHQSFSMDIDMQARRRHRALLQAHMQQNTDRSSAACSSSRLEISEEKSAAPRKDFLRALHQCPYMVCATCFQRPRETVNMPCMCMCNCLECDIVMVVCSMCYSRIESSFQCNL